MGRKQTDKKKAVTGVSIDIDIYKAFVEYADIKSINISKWVTNKMKEELDKNKNNNISNSRILLD